MAYADYEFYKSIFLGVAIAEADFPRFALRASEEVDSITRGRAEAYHATNPLPVQKATCAIAEVLQEQESGNALANMVKDGRGTIRSESVGGESYSYDAINTADSAGQAAMRSRIYAAAAKYLQSTGLLYAGVPSC